VKVKMKEIVTDSSHLYASQNW